MLLDARVRIDALSVRRLFAVAAEYVVGCGPACCGGAKCGGRADAGDAVVGNGWLNVIECELLALLWCDPCGALGFEAPFPFARD